MDCIFCRIGSGAIPAKRVYEDDLVVAFDDIAPQAPVHVLVCPKAHRESLAALGDEDSELAARLLLAVRKVAEAKGIAERGYRVISNVREHGGQEVMHLHIHVVGGRKVGRMLPGVMPMFCPTCKQEYEDWAKTCPDCEVALVSDLAAAAAKTPVQAAAIGALDAGARRRITELLTAGGVAFRVEAPALAGLPAEGGLVLIPVAFAAGVLQALTTEPGLETALAPAGAKGAFAGVFRSAPAKEVDAIHDPPLLREPPQRLAARGEAALPELLEIVRRGDEEARQAALGHVARLGKAGVDALAGELLRLAKEHRSEALYAVARKLRDLKAAPTHLDGLLALAEQATADIDARVLALHVLGRGEHLPLAARLVPLILDRDELVREAADEALCNLTDEDLGFEPDMPPAERQALVAKWQQLLARKGA